MDTNVIRNVIRHKVLLWRICKRPIGGLTAWITCQFNGEASKEIIEEAQAINKIIPKNISKYLEELPLFVNSQEIPSCDMKCSGCEALTHLAL